MKVSASPFETPVAAGPLSSSERAGPSAESAAVGEEATVVPPVAANEEGAAPGAGDSTNTTAREALLRLTVLVRRQLQAQAELEAIVPEAEIVQVRNPSSMLAPNTVASIPVAQAIRTIKEARKERGRELYRALAKRQLIGDVEAALADDTVDASFSGDPQSEDNTPFFLDDPEAKSPSSHSAPIDELAEQRTKSQIPDPLLAGFILKRAA